MPPVESPKLAGRSGGFALRCPSWPRHSGRSYSLAHENGLKDELDEAWAVRLLELSREGGRTMLVLDDPGGEPLDGLLGAPLELGRFLRFSTGIAATLGRAHQRGLIHKNLKPAHTLANLN